MTVQKDNHIDPNTKARWGFAGGEGEVTVGPQTVGETGGVDHARTRTEGGAARNSGGGADETQAIRLELGDTKDQLTQALADLAAERAKNADPRDSLTIPEIKEQLDAKEVKYSSTANKAELLELLKAQPATQE